jgi:hypothetical protein
MFWHLLATGKGNLAEEVATLNIFSVSSDIQDVEVLLGNVAGAVRQWEGGEIVSLDLSLMLGEASQASQRAGRLKGQWNLNSWAIIQSTRPGLGPWIIRFQHLVRRATWWYLEPIIQQIRAFQMNAALVMDALAQNQAKALTNSQAQTAELAALQKRVEALEAQLQRQRSG